MSKATTPPNVAQPNGPLTLYRFALSGHSHRVELMLSLLELPFTAIDVDLRGGEQKRPAFLQMNAFGQVPVLNDNGTIVADSNAILVYLASRYDTEGRYLPRDAVGAAAVQRWLSVAAGTIAYGPAAARRANLFGGKLDEAAQTAAHNLFKVMDTHLGSRRFLCGDTVTIADLACYSYVAHAPEGGIALTPYPHVAAWLQRIEALPRFVPMPRSAVGLAAPAACVS